MTNKSRLFLCLIALLLLDCYFVGMKGAPAVSVAWAFALGALTMMLLTLAIYEKKERTPTSEPLNGSMPSLHEMELQAEEYPQPPVIKEEDDRIIEDEEGELYARV